MPSDERLTRTIEAVRRAVESHRAAVAATCAQLREYLEAHRTPTAGRAELAAAALGHFAGGRLDSSRFAAAFEGGRVLAPEDVARIEQCIATLTELVEAGDAPYVHELPGASDLEGAIERALAQVGRAFAAALVFQAIKTQVYRDEVHAPLLAAFPFARWNRAERMVAPPLVLHVEGSDVDAPRLARFLDGRVRLVLVVRGGIAPAALASLVTPGTFVMHADDIAELVQALDARGPAVAALVGDTAARFVHDPAGGPRLVDRLQVRALPAEPPQHAIGRYTAPQLREQLAQLATLQAAARAEANVSAAQAMETTTVVAAAAAAAGGGTQAVDTLAGWLLAQAGMTEGAAR